MKHTLLERVEQLEKQRVSHYQVDEYTMKKLYERIERVEKIIESMGYYIP
jgi:flagellar biosynthesis/type III secretory pathway chaperone